ncbi:MAG TPA: hydantoinase B/oxoprolinase family protein [Gaiellaceae bacterium]
MSETINVYRGATGAVHARGDADPVTTEVIRHGLNSAADQMKRALIRTAFSPVIYEMLDFVTAIYDREVRLLAQAQSLPIFMGTMNFAVQAAVEAVGGESELEPGDIVFYNWPYGTGSHPNDLTVVMPVFHDDEELIGYATVKGHWLDIGGKDPYSTDTVDVFQEGTIFPGVKLYSRGELVKDIWKMAMANSRLPKMVSGDINAEVVAVRTGANAFLRVVNRYGVDTFRDATERMFDHGEAIVRSYFERIPDGRYVAQGEMDSNGLDDEPVPFEVAIEVEGSTVRVDYSNAPDASAGPINCPLPCTVSASRIAILNLAGGGDFPNEGHFRPLEVVTRPGSMFHPNPPSPVFLFGWSAMQAIEVVYNAIAQVLPQAVPACSGGDIQWFVWWGTREETGEPWADGCVLPVGKGGHSRGDGANSLIHLIEAATRVTPSEVWEAKNPFLLERVELAADSCGAGEYRGGLGVDYFFEVLEEQFLTSTSERTKNAPWGIAGGLEARPNAVAVRMPDGERVEFSKITRFVMPKGSVLEIRTGGGGGYGDPSKRRPEDVHFDLREGYITEEHAREHYPHAFD